MCRLLLLVAFTTALAAAEPAQQAQQAQPAELKPIAALPWCRVTIDMGDDEGVKRPPLVRDGWYDADTHLLLSREAAEGKNPFLGTLSPERILKIETAKQAPPLPAKGREIANRVRAEKSKQRE